MRKVAQPSIRSSATRYAVITADVVSSRAVSDFETLRDLKLQDLSKRHKREQRIISPYTVTAWDEFQVILRSADQLPQVLFDLRRFFAPVKLWIAVGFGTVANVDRRPINRYAGGEAFERARIAADELKLSRSKYRTMTQFNTGIPLLDHVANSICHLQDTLMEGLSDKQWKAINAQLGSDMLSETAGRLNIDISTLSRTLRRGHFWQFEETMKSMQVIIREILGAEEKPQ